MTYWYLASGELVKDREFSHLHGNVHVLLPRIFSSLYAAGREMIIAEHNFGRVVGKTTCVWTHPNSNIVFAQRHGRYGLTRFVKNRSPEPCSVVTVIIMWQPNFGSYKILTAYCGHQAEPEPWDRFATEQSVAFWNSHALIWGSESIVPGTETNQCPW